MSLNKDESLEYALTTTLNVLRKKFNSQISPYNLSSEQYAVMRLVDEIGEITPTKIAELLKRDKATITRIINSLEKKGFINKKYINSKSYYLLLTQEGKINLKFADKVAVEFQNKIKSILSEEEFKCLLEKLQKIRNNF
ncbi:MarR family winged helix-turn-helix transcriptional regulator [Caminibacter sp.]